MTALTTVVTLVHQASAALWIGSVVFVTAVVLPAARTGGVQAPALDRILRRFVYATILFSTASVLSGGYMAASSYGVADLLGTGRGHLVLTMTVLWLVFTAVSHVGASRLRRALGRGVVRSAVAEHSRWFYAASTIAIVLLVVISLLG